MGWNQQPQLASAGCIVQYGLFGDLCRSANCSGRQGAGRHARQKYRQMNLVRWWYYSYYLLFYCFATAVGLLSRLYFGETSGFDPEMALPNMARDLLPPWLAGLMLAGIFAATMSTADSLVLSCSSAITQDLPRKPSENRWFLKAATAMNTVFALGIGLWSEQSVFSLVVWAWGTLGAIFTISSIRSRFNP